MGGRNLNSLTMIGRRRALVPFRPDIAQARCFMQPFQTRSRTSEYLMPRMAFLSILLAASLAAAMPSGAAGPPPSEVVVVTATDAAWEITVPVAHATLVVPRGGFQSAEHDKGGAMSSPRYFRLEDTTHGETIVSGWFESAERVKNVEEMLQSSWKGESQGLARAGVTPEAVESGHIGGWATITWEAHLPAGTSVHVRASRIVADTWIDLHLSITSTAKAEESKAAVTKLLESLAVRQR